MPRQRPSPLPASVPPLAALAGGILGYLLFLNTARGQSVQWNVLPALPQEPRRIHIGPDYPVLVETAGGDYYVLSQGVWQHTDNNPIPQEAASLATPCSPDDTYSSPSTHPPPNMLSCIALDWPYAEFHTWTAYAIDDSRRVWEWYRRIYGLEEVTSCLGLSATGAVLAFLIAYFLGTVPPRVAPR